MQNDEIEKKNKVIKKLGEKTRVNSGYLDWPATHGMRQD